MSLPFFGSRPVVQDFLRACVEALVTSSPDLDDLMVQTGQDMPDQMSDLVELTQRLSRVLTEVEPSEVFVDELRRQLEDMGYRGQRSLWGRIRHLPPRTQLAAGIGGATLTAGVVLIASRPIRDALDEWLNRRSVVA